MLVTGASGLVGEATVRAFLGRDEVRATVRRPETAEPLRALGAKVSVRAADRVEVLAEVLGGVHTVVHLIGGPNEPDADAVSAANHGTTLAALEAARLTGVRRFLFVSVPDADPRSADPFLRAKGLAEQAIAASGLEHAIVRAAPVYGLGGLWFAALVEGALAEPPFVVGDPDREVAPLFVDDLAEALALLDDLEGPLEGTYALEGPEVLPLAEVVGWLRGDDRAPAPLPEPVAEALGRRLATAVWPTAAAFLARAGRAQGSTSLPAMLGSALPRTGLAEGLDRTLVRAGLRPG
ncbi:MAG: hypothetical protein KatS3mg013_0131 [Actinomycetota bacterium]|nr:MAG: hypothetical protein KatS3mg013_0131 [Actinomycetota bacterium]